MKTHSSFGPLQIIIVVLTVAIALIHMMLLFPDTFFLLNGAGYLVLLTLLYLPSATLDRFRRFIRWLFIAYAAATIIFWITWGVRLTLGYISVAAEALLIVLLAYEGYRAHWANSGPDSSGTENDTVKENANDKVKNVDKDMEETEKKKLKKRGAITER